MLTYGRPDALRSEVPRELHLPFASSFPSSQLINLLSQGFVVLRPRLGGRGVSNSRWSWSGVPTSQNAEVNQGQWGT